MFSTLIATLITLIIVAVFVAIFRENWYIALYVLIGLFYAFRFYKKIKKRKIQERTKEQNILTHSNYIEISKTELKEDDLAKCPYCDCFVQGVFRKCPNCGAFVGKNGKDKS